MSIIFFLEILEKWRAQNGHQSPVLHVGSARRKQSQPQGKPRLLAEKWLLDISSIQQLTTLGSRCTYLGTQKFLPAIYRFVSTRTYAPKRYSFNRRQRGGLVKRFWQRICTHSLLASFFLLEMVYTLELCGFFVIPASLNERFLQSYLLRGIVVGVGLMHGLAPLFLVTLLY